MTDASVIEDDIVPLGVVGETDDVVNINDDAVPLAASVKEDSVKTMWGWFTTGILALLAAVTGKTAYDRKAGRGIFGKSKENEKDEDR